MSRSATPGAARDTPPKPAPPPPPGWRRWLLPIGLLVTVLLLFIPAMSRNSPQQLTYSNLLDRVNADHVTSVSIDNHGAVTGQLSGGKQFTSQIPTSLTTGTNDLQTALLTHHVKITGTQKSDSSVLGILLSFLPLLLIIGLFVWTGRAARRSFAGGIGGVGRSRAKISDVERPKTRFADVAGYEGAKEEITEVVDFLRAPDRYTKVGAVGPRGVLMVGPPGTGKTLLARAVAGEADVPFLSITGSGFVELFVGVGASRVRDLFAEARKRAPSIIFIDEIDSIGGRRGGRGSIGGNDEREQTLNQLLGEMDGFDDEADVVVLAATNRPETLDPALLRPGRFDRQVVVPLPTQRERAAILAVHARDKQLAPDVDLDRVARATPGFSGADLANLLNEAAINAVRANRAVISAADLDAARDRALLGRRDASNALLPEERRSVAVHEAGHAMVAALSPNADPVAKVTILPAGMALGVTEQLPEAERHLYTENYLTDALAVKLGGRAAELIVLGQGSTGAANDLLGATQLATRMVVEFGLSTQLGPVSYSDASGSSGSGQEILGHPYSEGTQRVIDQEVARLVREAEQTALTLLQTHRAALDRLADLLLVEETVDGSVVLAALRDPDTTPPADGATDARAAAERLA